ncbi:MAG: hypothetical protein HYT87_20005 [Nitrospirae bacterium]|nr:hypothetical protein [Nitrospirota bacterium]
MGAVYKRKRRSCGLCKPHKKGLAPKKTPQLRAEEEAMKKEIDEATRQR